MLKSLGTSSSGSVPDSLLTKILHPADPRTKSTLFDHAREKELGGVVKRGVFKIVFREEIALNANIIGESFVLTIKNTNAEQELYKATVAVQGHSDAENTYLYTTHRQFDNSL